MGAIGQAGSEERAGNQERELPVIGATGKRRGSLRKRLGAYLGSVKTLDGRRWTKAFDGALGGRRHGIPLDARSPISALRPHRGGVQTSRARRAQRRDRGHWVEWLGTPAARVFGGRQWLAAAAAEQPRMACRLRSSRDGGGADESRPAQPACHQRRGSGTPPQRSGASSRSSGRCAASVLAVTLSARGGWAAAASRPPA